MHADRLLVDDAAAVLPRDRHAHKVAQPDVDAVVRLVLLVDVREFERVRLGAHQLARRLQLAHERRELVGVAAVLQQLDQADKLDLDAHVLELFAARDVDLDRARDVIIRPKQILLLVAPVRLPHVDGGAGVGVGEAHDDSRRRAGNAAEEGGHFIGVFAKGGVQPIESGG